MHTYIHKYVRMYMQLHIYIHISSLKTIREEGEREAD